MFLKKRNISSKIKRSKVTDYAALMPIPMEVYIVSNGLTGTNCSFSEKSCIGNKLSSLRVDILSI